jgi:hypothetical protein
VLKSTRYEPGGIAVLIPINDSFHNADILRVCVLRFNTASSEVVRGGTPGFGLG